MDYANMPKTIGVAMSYVSLRDLDSFYSLEDMYDILEKHAVDAHNAKLVAKANNKRKA